MKYKRLSDFADFRTERTANITFENYISTENMIRDKGGIMTVSSLPDAKTTSAYKTGDILLSNIRPYFKKIWFATQSGSCSNDVLVLKTKKNILPLFLYYVLSDDNFFNYDTITSKGTKMPRGTPNAIMKYLVPDIQVDKQTKIASILSAYDDLIENNNKRIKILEQMAENLYKEWFVRFRFPGYETAEFENGIPKGWDIVELKKIAKLKSGYAFKSEWWTEIGVPVIKIKDIQDGKITLHQLDCVSKENAEKAKKFMVQSGDLLIALTGATIGKTALIVYEGYLVNQRVGKFFVKNPSVDYIGFLYCLINRPWIQEKIICYAGSNAAQPNISPLDIENFKILYNKEIVDKFNVKIKTIIKMIISLQKTNFLLIKQRDLLLPRLMSGKLEV